MDFIYNSIIERLTQNKAVFEEFNVPFIQYFDLFKSQYIYPELHLPYKRPALFYEWAAQWTDKGVGIQQGDLTLRLHLELENYGESFVGMTRTGQVMESKNKGYALEIFEMQKLVHAIISGLEGEAFTPLRRISTDPDLNPINTNVTLITYSTKVTDDTAFQIADRVFERVPLDDMQNERVETTPPVEEEDGYYSV